jgi:acetylornithine deacetylase/succinyl-diaminopimelate desuccinylase-like protein
VYGELPVPGAKRTVIFYAHYDGQPVDPRRWKGHAPFEPVLRSESLERGGEIISFPEKGGFEPGWRIYARSASDDKSPIVALMVAIDALRANDIAPTANLKFIFEGDEEAGSPNLGELIERHGDLLKADLLVAADGPRDPSGQPTLYFGARGIVSAEITVFGPLRPLHSGHYGNWAPNPAMRLAQLLASMKHPESGRVLIDGFYEDVVPLSDFERRAIREAPLDDEAQMRQFAIAAPEMEGMRLELINQPSLNVRGLRSGWVGSEARTIVPDVAVASIDMRLVKDIDPAEQVERLIAHVRRQGYQVVEQDPDPETRRAHERLAKITTSDGYPAFRTSMDLPVSLALIDAIESNSGERAVKLPTLGGSVPLYYFTDVLGVPTVGIPIVNHDNNQHSPNENLRLGHFFSGIEILAAAMLIE